MQVSELQDLIGEVTAEASPAPPDLWDKVVHRARRHRRRRRVGTAVATLVVCVAIAAPVAAAVSAHPDQVVTVGPLHAPVRSSADTSRSIPPAIANVLRANTQSFGQLTLVTEVALKEMRWKEFTSRVPHGLVRSSAPRYPPPSGLVYVLLRSGSDNPAETGQPPRDVSDWEISIINVASNTGFYDLAYVEDKSRRPPFWSGLPGIEYDLNPSTGKITILRK